MKRSGRASLVAVAGAVGIIIILGFIVSSGDSPGTVGARFMAALVNKDSQTLTDLSDLQGRSADEVKKEWDRTLHDAEHYRFKYRIVSAEEPGPDQAVVRVAVERNYNPNGTSYEENFQLPLKKESGKWKVQTFATNRQMYPFWPR